MAWINFEQFWNYYKGSARKDYSEYKKKFMDAYNISLREVGLDYSHSTVAISKHKKELFAKMKVHMLSYGVPSAAVTHILDHFKKWFHEMYE